MLSSFNSGKYLTRTYEREREACAQNKDQYSTTDQAFYEVSGQSPGMGDRDRMEDTFTISTDPVCSGEISRDIDQRNKPEVGW
jgi:hypothetical protein